MSWHDDRDLTPVPAYAGLGAEGISRDEAYAENDGSWDSREGRGDDDIDSAVQRRKDMPSGQASASDAGPGQPRETGPESAPDARADDQRPVTVADMKTALAEVRADSDARSDALSARYEPGLTRSRRRTTLSRLGKRATRPTWHRTGRKLSVSGRK